MEQRSLLCGCGGLVGCRRCARRARLDRSAFAGQRELVLRRDDYQCQCCGELDATQIIVHHRSRTKLVTMCRGCHARVHHLARPGFALAINAPFLYSLWREINRGPEQIFLPIAQMPAPDQAALFELGAK